MPRFVILRHEMPAAADRGSHWDLMLESGARLRTWALDELPRADAAVAARALADHRLVYLDYEGPVSNNRGEVSRYDWGEYELLEDSATALRIELRGQKLQGFFALALA